MKLAQPIETLTAQMPWVGDSPAVLVRFIGLAELLGAVGLIVPAATRGLPQITPLAAAGLALVMVLAAAFHISRSEIPATPVNVVLTGLLGLIAWGRWKKAPILSRHLSPA